MSNQATSKEAKARVQAGDVLAEKYIVERVLAEGGMGVVVAAKHAQLGRRVALKFLLPELCEKEEVVARFLREAQSMTAIQNEHVARVLDVGKTTEGAPYMVMEYLEGEDLSQRIERQGQLTIDEAVEFVLQGMEAVAEAHLHGIVHRDLKPSNLFVTARPDGSPLVKVLDFGISKVATDGAAADLTQAQGLLGSPLYMAPEQIRSSKSVDVRADIWALGIILFELMSGRTPFDDAETVQAVLAAIVADDPATLSSVRPDVPTGLSEIVARCLRRPRDERFANVAELATALYPYATREGRLSIERIERVDAHSKRISAPGLRTTSPPISAPATRTGPGELPPSPLAATAVASSEDATPTSSQLRLARLAMDSEPGARGSESKNTPGALTRSSSDAVGERRTRGVVLVAGAFVLVTLVVTGFLLRPRRSSSPPPPVVSVAAATAAAPPVTSSSSRTSVDDPLPSSTQVTQVTSGADVPPARSTVPRSTVPPSRTPNGRAPRAQTAASAGAATAAESPPTPSASGRKKRELDDSPYEQ